MPLEVIELVSMSAEAIIMVALNGSQMFRQNLTGIIFLMSDSAQRLELPITPLAIATPVKPNRITRIGVNVQVKAVQNSINLSVVSIFPIALRVLVSGVVMAEKAIFKQNQINAGIAGNHLVYCGIARNKLGAKILIPARMGKITIAIKNILFSTAIAKRF